MPQKAVQKKLRLAMQEEQAQLDEVVQRYLNLAVKMSAYQASAGPAPTGEGFEDCSQRVA